MITRQCHYHRLMTQNYRHITNVIRRDLSHHFNDAITRAISTITMSHSINSSKTRTRMILFSTTRSRHPSRGMSSYIGSSLSTYRLQPMVRSLSFVSSSSSFPNHSFMKMKSQSPSHQCLEYDYSTSSSLRSSLFHAFDETIRKNNSDNNDNNDDNNNKQDSQRNNLLSYYNDEQRHVMKRCYEINHNIIMKYNHQWNGPLEQDRYYPRATTNHDSVNDKEAQEVSTLPIVLLLGNHSSGKSTFCNYILGRPIQTSGVAPTDDHFTIIAPGPVDYDQNGIALAGNVDLGFTSLRQFGPTLLAHTTYKVRADIRTNFILIDSPGMIDSPSNYTGMLFQNDPNSTNAPFHHPSPSQYHHHRPPAPRNLDRGYDFTGVVRWYANRADIVCLFFDPDKPGTTGETLHVLLHALSGMDHKLMILLNKADQFTKIHDFARAYGSLCWNLSKVIPRKDLPKIYTMCLPTSSSSTKVPEENTTTKSSNNDHNNNNTSLSSSSIYDLQAARNEVVNEVYKAPLRRIDNVISDLEYSVQQLHMYGVILQDIHTKWSNYIWTLRYQFGAVLLSGTTATGFFTSLLYYKDSIQLLSHASSMLQYMTGITLGGTLLLSSGLYWYQTIQHNEYKKRYVYNADEVLLAFQRTYRKSIIRDHDEYISSIYQNLHHIIVLSLHEYQNVNDMPIITNDDIQQLKHIIDNDIPQLRRMVQPKHHHS